jgi:hypothetical protein
MKLEIENMINRLAGFEPEVVKIAEIESLLYEILDYIEEQKDTIRELQEDLASREINESCINPETYGDNLGESPDY